MKNTGVIITSGKRKTAIARAVTRKGNGQVTINGYPVEFHPVELLRNKIREPLDYSAKKHPQLTLK